MIHPTTDADKLHTASTHYDLVTHYIKLLQNTPATVRAASGYPSEVIHFHRGDSSSLVVTEEYQGKRFVSTLSQTTSITPKRPFNHVYRLPEQDTTPEMEQWHEWQSDGTIVKVFLTNGFQADGYIKSYARGVIVLATTDKNGHTVDMLMLSISKVSENQK